MQRSGNTKLVVSLHVSVEGLDEHRGRPSVLKREKPDMP